MEGGRGANNWKEKGSAKRKRAVLSLVPFLLHDESSCPSSFLFFPTVQIAPFDVEEEETETDIASLHPYRNCGTNTSFRFSGKGEWYVRRMYQVLSPSKYLLYPSSSFSFKSLVSTLKWSFEQSAQPPFTLSSQTPQPDYPSLPIHPIFYRWRIRPCLLWLKD